MIGAEALIRTLLDSGVEVCFANPGTSEMHFVAALDGAPRMRAVLGLFEGTVTGAADGYGRMAERPAVTLLHLGPGLGNGFANLHNARRAATPVVNVIGEHATYHQALDAPLHTDIESIAGALEGWTRRIGRLDDVGPDTAAAVAAALGPPGRVANLILPADLSWSDGAKPAHPQPTSGPARVGNEEVAAALAALRSAHNAVLLIGGAVTRKRGLVVAARIAAATGARVFTEGASARVEAGEGIPAIPRLGYFAEAATAQLADARHLILAGARAPVSFFAYPDRPSELTPAGCQVHTLGDGGMDVVSALEEIADALGAPALTARGAPATVRPTGSLNTHTVAAAVTATLPDGAVISDEAVTAGAHLAEAMAGARPHDALRPTGGAIGQGLPVAVGAAVACPDRPVLALQADGSAMYTISTLWTMAREGLDVTVLILDNGAYKILQTELTRVGANPSSRAAGRLLDLTDPRLDFVALGHGMGVPSSRATTAEELTTQLEQSYTEPGPHLIHAVLSC